MREVNKPVGDCDACKEIFNRMKNLRGIELTLAKKAHDDNSQNSVELYLLAQVVKNEQDDLEKQQKEFNKDQQCDGCSLLPKDISKVGVYRIKNGRNK